MLPPPVAKLILNGEAAVQKYDRPIAVAFVDIVAFDKLFCDLKGHEVVALLNHVYVEFDRHISDKCVHTIKIETVSEVYMLAAGLFDRDDTPPLKYIAELAATLATLQQIAEKMTHARKGSNGAPVQIKTKVGFHVGPLVAGVGGGGQSLLLLQITK